MRGDSGNTRGRRIWLEKLPYYFFGHSLPLDLVRAIHGEELLGREQWVELPETITANDLEFLGGSFR